MSSTREPRQPRCPSWCVVRHGPITSEDDPFHVSGALLVRRTVLRLCITQDPSTGEREGPFVLLGEDRYALHEVEALIDALTELAEHGASSLASQEGEGALPVLHT